MKRRVALAVCALSLASCSPRSAAPPPAAPSLVRASDAIPADLDLVVRLDLSRVKAALGPEILKNLRHASSLATESDGTERLIAELLQEADVVLIGVRPRAASVLDHVLVLEGRFERFDPAALETSPRWHRARDLGAEFRRWDRSGRPGRGSPALAYARGERLIVLATPAEIDSTERAVEQGAQRGALSPPSKGFLSFAARVVPLSLALEDKAPTLARLLRAAERLEGSAEIEADGIHLELALKVDGPETAESVSELLRALTSLLALKRATADIASSARFEIAGEYVMCRVTIPRSVIARGLACAEAPDACSW